MLGAWHTNEFINTVKFILYFKHLAHERVINIIKLTLYFKHLAHESYKKSKNLLCILNNWPTRIRNILKIDFVGYFVASNCLCVCGCV